MFEQLSDKISTAGPRCDHPGAFTPPAGLPLYFAESCDLALQARPVDHFDSYFVVVFPPHLSMQINPTTNFPHRRSRLFWQGSCVLAHGAQRNFK